MRAVPPFLIFDVASGCRSADHRDEFAAFHSFSDAQDNAVSAKATTSRVELYGAKSRFRAVR